jgi:surfactin synthase thioesterase subunit
MINARVVAQAWLHPVEAEPDAQTRLFLFHHSGGSATLYQGWPSLLPPSIAVQSVQLPGRQERHREPAYTHIDPLVQDLTSVLAAAWDGRPYALFGHSMGALLAYRVAVAMAAAGWPGPCLVAASGWAPAGVEPTARELFDYRSDAEIVAAMRSLGSLPTSISDDVDLLAFAVRAMRADAAACASYRDDEATVDCPIVAYAGRSDPLLAPAAMRSWATRTPRYLGCRELPGGHFFVYQHARVITADLAEAVGQAVRRP